MAFSLWESVAPKMAKLNCSESCLRKKRVVSC